MEKHLTREKLELFLQDLLPGDEAVDILLHLEDCELCRNLVPDEDAEQVIRELLADNENDDDESTT